MEKQRGLFIVIGEDGPISAIERAVEESRKFTTVVPASGIRPKPSELCLVSLRGESVDYVGVSQGGSRVTTGQKRISVSQIAELGGPTLASLRRALPPKMASRLKSKIARTTRLSPRLWEEVLKGLTSLQPDLHMRLAELRQLIAEFHAAGRREAGGLEVFERDAVASALQVWGGTKYRKEMLRSAAASAAASGNRTAPFLTRLGSVTLREDAQIIHDAGAFPGMAVASRNIVGAVELQNPFGERLTILHCNRQPLEQTLGVDLIYYNHRFDSFVLVQYKRMTDEGKGKVVYRPENDGSYASELERMKTIQRLIDAADAKQSGTVDEFRLLSRPFYFKLCEAKAKSGLDEGIVSGMYLPIDLWERFMASPAAKGKLGGTYVSWMNCPRRFNNENFAQLLKAGWIGSAAGQSAALTDIIEAILEGRHMLIYAATSSKAGQADFLRDGFGQFASEDDPLASR